MLRNLQHLGQYFRVGLGIVTAWATLSTPIAVKAEVVSSVALPLAQAQSSSWRSMTPEEQTQAWDYILNSPLGIAALNQLAIEGFISPICPKTFYTNEEFGGFQFMLRVQCPNLRGVSIAVGYSEMRAIFGRFESNIENFLIERVGDETPATIPLP
ncbi:MAG: hypothetical protein WBF52_07055 [Geitlerinemataceae cyanobacterium]